MSKAVMILDDSSTMRQAVSCVLGSAGYSVVEASNGKDALSMLDDHSIGLFISDVNMPYMDGIEFVKTLKSDEKYKFTPVIMLTTENVSEKIEEGKKAGVRAWIVKPFNSDTLLGAVKKLYIK